MLIRGSANGVSESMRVDTDCLNNSSNTNSNDSTLKCVDFNSSNERFRRFSSISSFKSGWFLRPVQNQFYREAIALTLFNFGFQK